MCKNRLLIAAAGSGKTTFLVKEALKITNSNVLITTFTEANESEIRKKIYMEKRCIPGNIKVQTWFSFLLQHGVRPYQSEMNNSLHDKRIGFCLFEGKSGFRCKNKLGKHIYWGEDNFRYYYFAADLKIYSDKISRFVYCCNEKTNGEILNRISRIYPYIFVDEVQDLAGWDLELLKLFFESSSHMLMVGDPRQATYSTNDSPKHRSYRGRIKEFIEVECKKNICNIDADKLKESHRNNENICAFSSRLFAEYPECRPCTCKECRKETTHDGIFLVKERDVEDYCKKYKPIILRYQMATYPELNYGISKGLTFDRVLIYPTEKIRNYLKKGLTSEIETVKEKFYVAMTRARYSVGIVLDYDDGNYIEGIQKYISYR